MKPNIEQFNPCPYGLEYYKSKASFEQAWNDCYRGDWMLWIAVKLEVDDRTLTRAKALCANTVRHLMKDERSRAAINGALMYADGKTGPKELKRYADYARAAYRDAKASEAAAHAAYAANWAANAACWAACAGYAAANAAYWAADRDAEAARVANRLEAANIFREVLTEAVFEKIKKLNNKES